MPSVQQPELFKNGIGLSLVGAVIIGGAVAAWCCLGHHFWTALKGPTEVTLADIAKLENPNQLPSTWVKVRFDKAAKSEVVMEEVRSGVSSIDEEYLIFQAGERWMIAAVPPNFKGNELSGQIWHNNASLAREAWAAVGEDLHEIHKGKLFPFEFDASDDYGTNWKSFAGVMGFLALCGGFLGCLGLTGVFRSFRAPSLADYGLSEEGDSGPKADLNEAMSRYFRNSDR